MDLINKLKKEEIEGKLIAIIILIIAVGYMLFQSYKDNEIERYKEKTTGKVVDFIYEARLDYGLIYEYYVNNKRYTNQIGVTFFKCDDGRKGCIGSEFTVFYSSRNPKFSKIDLGKYNEYQKD
ncbi:hypothetical protein [Tenacibaculum discolor]|uniref:hypothetical protein n=1 Tax=Tenacibaculum discolor TaxID=361581 RepID=UPI000EAC210A|nr:hypothetical protein [Tenacibaculum discolor]RLJ98715.1 hypothetical protein C8N27_2621 [Tenacibaculum discolor]